MEVTIMNKRNFDSAMYKSYITDDNVETALENYCLISITDTDKSTEENIPYFLKNHSNVLNLSFDDCSEDGKPSPTQLHDTTAFSIQQGMEVIDFIQQNKDKDYCIVHCAAGISRSSAIATFVNDLYGDSYEDFKQRHPWIRPNAHVSRILNNLKRGEQ